MKDDAGVRVKINVPPNLLERVKNPLDSSCLGFREGSRAVESLRRRVRRCNVGPDTGVELLQEVPQEVKVPVEVDAVAGSVAWRRRSRVSVLAPARVGGLIVGDTVRVAQGHKHDTGLQRTLDVAVGPGATAVGDTLVVFVGVQQVGDEVDDVVRRATLARVDGTVEEGTVPIGGCAVLSAPADCTTKDGAVLKRLIGGLECVETVLVGESIKGRTDLDDAQKLAGISADGLCSQTAGDDLAALEPITLSDGETRVPALATLEAGCGVVFRLLGEETGLCQLRKAQSEPG